MLAALLSFYYRLDWLADNASKSSLKMVVRIELTRNTPPQQTIEEIEGWNKYVGALAFHDLQLGTGTTYIEAAFDMHHPDIVHVGVT